MRLNHRHRHRDQRNQRGPPVLQEHQHHEGDEDDRIAERLEHLRLRFLDEGRRVVDDLSLEPQRKPFPQRGERRPHALRRADRIGPGQLVDVHPHARLAVEPADLIILLGPQFDAGHVAKPHDHRGHSAAGRLHLLHHDVVEFLDLKCLPVGGRLLADAPVRHLEILPLERLFDVVGNEIDRRHLLGIEPDPHGVVALSQEIDVAHALDPQQFIPDLDGGVVGEKSLVEERPARRVFLGGEVDDHHRRR